MSRRFCTKTTVDPADYWGLHMVPPSYPHRRVSLMTVLLFSGSAVSIQRRPMSVPIVLEMRLVISIDKYRVVSDSISRYYRCDMIIEHGDSVTEQPCAGQWTRCY